MKSFLGTLLLTSTSLCLGLSFSTMASAAIVKGKRPIATIKHPPVQKGKKSQLPSRNPKATHSGVGDLLSPSIYYLPVFNLSKQSCQNTLAMVSEKGSVIARVCPSIFKTCVMEGSCVFTDNQGEDFTVNYSSKVRGVHRFRQISADGCRWGNGPTGACLDPFHTVAADRRYHSIGEVIYVPKLRDLILPNGKKHNGYLIVRDVGGAIRGPNRFDFFTGIYGSRSEQNPFAKAGFSDTNHRFEYRVVRGDTAEQVRGARNFPNLPSGLVPDFSTP